MSLKKITAFAMAWLLPTHQQEVTTRWRMKQPVLPHYPIGKHGKSGVAAAKRAARKRRNRKK